jgi:hypothetical protein
MGAIIGRMTRLSATKLPANPANRRALERAPTNLRAKAFPGGLDCTIRDYTKKGAKLQFEISPPLEERLLVVIWSSGLAFEAETRWRHGSEIGVLFHGSRDLRRYVPPELAPVAAQWRARRQRVSRRKLMRNADAIGGWEKKALPPATEE